jgi:hypothetical protein
VQTGGRGLTASGKASLISAIACVGMTLFCLRLGSGHTQVSRRFAALPEFNVWIWIYAAEVGAAAALGIASFPAFWLLARTTGRHASALAVAAWPTLGVLVALFGPQAVGNPPLWLGPVRFIAVNAIAWIFITPSFAGLLLVQTRLSALARETAPAVEGGTVGELVSELSWLRAAMLRFLITFAIVITAGLLALGALRAAVLAFGTQASHVPALRLLTYGGLLTGITALIFVPAYLAWQERVFELRDILHPIPGDGRPAHDWFQAREDFDTLLAVRSSAGRVFAAVFSVLAPVAAGLVSALLPAAR